MAKYEIESFSAVNSESVNLGIATDRLDFYSTSLDTILNEVKEYWIQEAPDATKYIESLTSTINDLRGIISCCNDLTNAIDLYLISLEQTSSRSVDQ